MTRSTRKRIVIGAVIVVVAGLLVFAFLPKPVPVRTTAVRRGPLQVTVEEEGRTEVADRYEITAPVSAFLRRITLEEGDVVRRGQPVASLEPPRSPLLDPRARTEASERVNAAAATARNSGAERDRVARLAADGASTRQALEQATSEATRAAAELAAAEAALRRTELTPALAVRRVLAAPAGGRVLQVKRRSEGQVNPGETLLVIGDARKLEVHVDVLSEDAVRMRPGTRVVIEQWGGDQPLEAVVQRVEPQGFTKVSSLGVEEQRVNVVATITSPAEQWASLGSGYRVLARFVLWEAPSVLQVPASALFRLGGGWAAFTVEGGRARRRAIVVGHQAGLRTEVVSGLKEGDEVILHPGNGIGDGAVVKAEREDPVG
jgi:HlyD family secretion protein